MATESIEKSPPAEVSLNTVGALLKKRRQYLKLTLAEVEVATKIRGKFLTAVESGSYQSLPNDIYSRGFVQHYADYLGLKGNDLAAQYIAERGGLEAVTSRRPGLDQPKRLVVTGRVAAVGSVVLAVVGIIVYLFWQFLALAAAPQLSLVSPAANQIVTGRVVSVTGRVSSGADVAINNSPVVTSNDGAFSERVALQDGVNLLRIVATSKLGKSIALNRHVLAKVPKLDAVVATVPAAPFDGVAVAVSVRDKATAMVVSVDGKEVWRGTVVAGWSQLFRGTNEIKLTTGNAGDTRVTVTNKTTAARDLGALGRSGEIRRDQSFTRDTVFP